MTGIEEAIAAVSNLGTTIVRTIWPNPADAANAQATVIKAQVDAAVAELQAAHAVMLAESQSADPWTSRARPSFLYVVYILLLAGIPMGVLYAISPTTAANVSRGFSEWLSAIPESIVELFKWVMLGYIGGRSFEKFKGASK